jgi:peptidoglycan/LPS O-acetylase OafA/YrhL
VGGDGAAGGGGLTGGGAGWTHRPLLDGLRTVAVYLAVLYHSGTSRVPGAFVAVDVFLVLSGYLVTGVLLRQHARTGSLDPRGFYLRRIRRLVPAATAMLAITAVCWRWLLSPSESADAADRYRAALLYVTNWDLIGIGSDYFAADPLTNPLLHLWSLAVEMQLYLTWPLVLGLLIWAAPRLPGPSRWTVRVGVMALGLGSVAVALWYQEHDTVRAYYATGARSFPFLAGALVALGPGVLVRSARHRLTSSVAAAGSLAAVLALSTDVVDLAQVHRSMAATVAAVVFVATVDGAVRWVRWPLGCAPVVYLGRISYGTYLWHWPVMSMVGRVTDAGPVQLVVVGALVASGLAALSHEILERPFVERRLLDRHGGVVAAAFVVTTAVAVVAVPLVIDPDRGAASVEVAVSRAGFTPVPADVDLDRDRLQRALGEGWVDCHTTAPADCTVVDGGGDHVLLIGDSTALSFMGTFESIARARDLSLSLAVAPGCPWQEDVAFTHPGALIPCDTANAFFHDELIPALDPDVIVVVGGYFSIVPSQPAFNPGDRLAVAIGDAIPRTLDALRRPGRRIVIFEPMPVAPFDPRQCLEDAEVVEACRFLTDRQPNWMEERYRALDQADDALWVVDFDGAVCPFLPICDPIVDGWSVRWDQQHLTAGFGASLAPVIDRLLAEAGVLADDPG